MRLMLSFIFFIFLAGIAPSLNASCLPHNSILITQIEKPSNKYLELMKWLTLQSNRYSGELNERQTWIVSFDGFQIKEEYYWDNELTVIIEFDIRDIEKSRNELRFFHSISLYPKDNDTSYLKVTRYDEGIASEVEAEYYNLMIDPTIKKEAHQKMEKVLELFR